MLFYYFYNLPVLADITPIIFSLTKLHSHLHTLLVSLSLSQVDTCLLPKRQQEAMKKSRFYTDTCIENDPNPSSTHDDEALISFCRFLNNHLERPQFAVELSFSSFSSSARVLEDTISYFS